MTTIKNRSISLIQAISGLFVTLMLFVSLLSSSSYINVNKLGEQFDSLSESALPLAFNNAKLTQSILQQIKQLNYGVTLFETDALAQVTQKVSEIDQQNTQLVETLELLSAQLGGLLSAEQKNLLNENMSQLSQISHSILASQANEIEIQASLEQAISTFRYGLSSIGPEMTRISSFLAMDNPESQDASNRFSAGASSMESTFLMLLMQNDIRVADKHYQEMKNRIAGIELAFDDFKEWHPDVTDFTSLTAPYDIVLTGFQESGVLAEVMRKIERQQQRQLQIHRVTQLANTTLTLLDDLSATASLLIKQNESLVHNTIGQTKNTVVYGGAAFLFTLLASWFSFKRWVESGLRGILSRLDALTKHDFRHQAVASGPREMREIAENLNLVISATQQSLSLVTQNCESLYQSSEISHGAAEQASQSLTRQNRALSSMVSTIVELESSINQISQVTTTSLADAERAAENTKRGVCVVEGSLERLERLEQSLNVNDDAMKELDSRVEAILEMVDMISGIAANTNLLALNAAIEAARAGEQGRGFAVVADEVRKLASDTSQQTTNISSMMNELVLAAERSRQSVDESRASMSQALASSDEVRVVFADIEYAVQHIRTKVEQIAQATLEQQRATTDVSKSITHVSDQAKESQHQLSAMVESSKQVSLISEQQQEMLHKYQLA
ncbi:TPA: methyl-accepting chemotaxis protein [Vibrio vulnificus]|nr:methyl-accepting chemotaxis protein [Vibrio vulnificus]